MWLYKRARDTAPFLNVKETNLVVSLQGQFQSQKKMDDTGQADHAIVQGADIKVGVNVDDADMTVLWKSVEQATRIGKALVVASTNHHTEDT